MGTACAAAIEGGVRGFSKVKGERDGWAIVDGGRVFNRTSPSSMCRGGSEG